MVKDKVLKKITKRVSPLVVDREGDQVDSPKQDIQTAPTKKRCVFCKASTSPSYTDTQALRRFTNDRSKIVPKLRSGVCSKHQRMVSRHIKYARHLALLPFIPKV